MAWSNEVFAKNLQMYMDINDMNQKELAEMVGVSAPTVHDWLKARKYPRIDKIEIIAHHFGILKSDLIEEHLDGETSKKIDVATDILIRMEKDKDFTELVNKLYKMDSAKIKAVKALLDSFSE